MRIFPNAAHTQPSHHGILKVSLHISDAGLAARHLAQQPRHLLGDSGFFTTA